MSNVNNFEIEIKVPKGIGMFDHTESYNKFISKLIMLFGKKRVKVIVEYIGEY